jgi:hypothetical protein
MSAIRKLAESFLAEDKPCLGMTDDAIDRAKVIIRELLDEVTFRSLYGNAHLHRLAGIWLLAQETNSTNAIAALDDEMHDGYFSSAKREELTSAEIFAKSDDLLRRAMSSAFMGGAR